jgi:hypothetical protein
MKNTPNWTDLWFDHQRAVLATMHRNLADDLEAGYHPESNTIREQRRDIQEREEQFEMEADRLRDMSEGAAKHWCYIDLKKNGVIE